LAFFVRGCFAVCGLRVGWFWLGCVRRLDLATGILGYRVFTW
jgi:hypothetical protein